MLRALLDEMPCQEHPDTMPESDEATTGPTSYQLHMIVCFVCLSTLKYFLSFGLTTFGFDIVQMVANYHSLFQCFSLVTLVRPFP